ncbi:MAG TPA: ABC transporter substrate-binding protein [Acidimicrobiales bacterium]|nr:ABC transporter substrate-binding protein [Acidimicrobiales bacterium]
MPSPRWTTPTALLVAALLTAGCGARWDEDQRAAMTAGGGTGMLVADEGGRGTTSRSEARTGAMTPSAADAATTPGAPGATGDPAAPGAAATDGGADAGEAAASGPRPCDAPSEAPGIADDTITIATVNSVTGPVPGLGTTSEAAARAYVAYRNATGGVCGRQVELVAVDDGTDAGRFRAAIVEMLPKVIGIGGLFANGDAGGAQLVEEAQLPVVGAASTTQFQDVSTVFDVNPPPADLGAVIEKYRYLKQQGVTKAAVITLSNAAAVAELDVHQAQMEAAGIPVVSRQVLPVATLSFDSAARQVANSGADYLFFLAAENHDAALARAMRDSGYDLEFEEYLTGYGDKYPAQAGPAAEGTSSWIRSLPNEDGGANPEQAAFLEWMERVAPGTAPDVYAAQGWVGAKGLLDAMEQLPGPITREAIVAQLRATTSFDAGGFFGDIDLGNERSKGCLIGMRHEGGQWRRMTPAQAFLC